MQLPSYSISEKASDNSIYKFISIGINGHITKLIIFSEYDTKENVYNLALVDLVNADEISDTSLSNNGDIRKIIATTAQAIIDYTLKFPERTIYFEGSDAEGKRITLYNAAIRRYYYLLQNEFYIEGYIDDTVKENFNPAKNYKAFLVKRK